ncbi:uncharacterized protein LOC109836626 isoform X2 [Asparagus officinalis]|uniref:uncharacterized protein LOC109836626 isoform X2 n=1 Tax=Asparagus officinalis TaxID=4686 RepID=UPI00098E12CE|nr:uncharacterized protein LOC109836626 isoform X2 [Asparagus officinalis]
MISGLGNYGNLLVEPLPGLKHDTGLAVDWSFNEQAILNDGLIKFADEQGMMKYVKIAASLPEKTVRDVALRCRWMAKENVKRRKMEETYAAKKIQNRKEKMTDSSTKANMRFVPPDNMAAYSFMLQNSNYNNRFSYEVPVIDGVTQRLLDENIQVLNQISTNLSTYKLHDNIELFSRTSNNITAILSSMCQAPGIMSQMPPLPVSVNEDLASSILPGTSQAPIYGAPSGIGLKQEPT